MRLGYEPLSVRRKRIRWGRVLIISLAAVTFLMALFRLIHIID